MNPSRSFAELVAAVDEPLFGSHRRGPEADAPSLTVNVAGAGLQYGRLEPASVTLDVKGTEGRPLTAYLKASALRGGADFTVETPVRLTDRQRELLRELEEINHKDANRHNPRAKSFMDKVREFFAG